MNNLINDFKTVQKITHESLIINNKMDFSSIWNPHQDFLPYLYFFTKELLTFDKNIAHFN